MDERIKPLPTVTEDNRRFWESCKAARLELPWCPHCARAFWPAAPVCPFCFSDEPSWREVCGQGVVSTWVVVHQPWFPSFAGEIPYNVIQVELDEGPRLTSSLVGVANDEIRIGMRVIVEFEPVNEDITLPRFRPVPPEGHTG